MRQASRAGASLPLRPVIAATLLRLGWGRCSITQGLYRVLVQLATTARLRQASRAGTSLPLRPVIAATLLRLGWGRCSTTQGWYRVLVQLATTARRQQVKQAATLPLPCHAIAATLLRPGWGRASTTQGWYRVPVQLATTARRRRVWVADLQLGILLTRVTCLRPGGLHAIAATSQRQASSMLKCTDRVHLLQANAISVTVNTIIRNRATNAIPQAPGINNEIGRGCDFSRPDSDCSGGCFTG